MDITSRESIERSLDGVDAVHFSLHGPAGAKKNSRVEPDGIRSFAALAESSDVRAMTYSSGATVGDEDDTFYVTRGKLLTENALLESDIPTTIFRPSWFMETLDMLVRGNRAMMPARMPNLLRPVAGRDYGKMVAKAFSDDVGAGIYYVYGPQAMTMADALVQILHYKAPGGKVMRVSPTMMKVMRTLLGGKAAYGLDLMSHFQNAAEPSHPGTADEVFGRNTTSLSEWLSNKYGEHEPEQPADEPGDPTPHDEVDDDDEQVFDLPLRGGSR